MEWNIVLDSSCDMTLDDFKHDDKIGFEKAPLKIIIGEKEYIDEDGIDTGKLLADMKAEKRASSSACPSPGDFVKAFVKAENTVCVTISSALSGAYNSACLARDMIAEEFPQKKIHVVDTKATAGNLTLVARKAREFIERGFDFDKVCRLIDEYNNTLRIVFSLASFDNLIKNGRMSPFVGAVATYIGIRVVAEGNETGNIKVGRKVRGEKKAIEEMVRVMKQNKDLTGLPVIISHCHNEKAAVYAKQLIEEGTGSKDVSIYTCKALTTFYAMQDGLIISY